MTRQCDELIERVLSAVPGAVDRRGSGDWHAEKGRRAVAIDDDMDDTGTEFILHRMRSDDADTGGNGTWNFEGDPESGTADEVLRLAKEWLL